MKPRKGAVCFPALLLLISCVCAAQAQNQPVRDPEAISVVEQALGALGGQQSNLQLRTAVIRGTMQGEGEQTTSILLWEDDFGNKLPEFRKEIRSGATVRMFVSGHGSPAHQHDGTVQPLSRQIGLATAAFYLPGVVLARELNNPDYSFRFIRDNSGFIHIRTVWELNPATAAITSQDWFFDATTKMPVRVQSLMPSNHRLGQTKASTVAFSGFRSVSGILVASHFVTQGPDSKSKTITISDVEINGAAIDRTHFELSGSQQ
jgi:hypothetical protein